MFATPYFSTDELAAYRRDGFVVVRGLYGGPALEKIVSATNEVEGWPETPGEHMRYYEESLKQTGRRVLNRVENFCPYHRAFEALFNAGELPARVAELFGEPAVLFKEKINFKMPGGGGFTPHQDIQAGWEVYGSLYLTALISIDAATVENGCLELAAGHHARGRIGDDFRPLSGEETAGMDFVPCPTAPGDAVFFDSFVPHRSAPNMTDSPRRVLYVTYNRASDGDHRVRYYADKRKSYPPDCEREPGKSYVFRV